jgi:hypothetical protein
MSTLRCAPSVNARFSRFTKSGMRRDGVIQAKYSLTASHRLKIGQEPGKKSGNQGPDSAKRYRMARPVPSTASSPCAVNSLRSLLAVLLETRNSS